MPKRTLTTDQELAIQARLDAGETGRRLAIEFGVSPNMISRIRLRGSRPRRVAAMVQAPTDVDDARGRARRLGASVRALVAQHVTTELSAEDTIVVHRTTALLLADVDGLLLTIARVLSDARAVSSSNDRPRVLAACRALGVPPPRAGMPADLSVAKARRKRLARQYHPDLNGGATVARFNDIHESFAVLRMYNERIEHGHR